MQRLSFLRANLLSRKTYKSISVCRLSTANHGFHKWITDFNSSIAENPKISLVTLLGVRNICFYGLAGIYGLTCTFSPELGIGFLIAKFTSKFRQPANVALAGAISYIFPVMKTIKCAPLLGLVSTPPTPGAPEITETHNDASVTKMQKFLDYIITGPVDKYGFSLFIASKLNFVITVLVGSYSVYIGMDSASILASLGISETLQAGGAAMGAATLTNIFLLPLQLYALPIMSPVVAHQYAKHTSST
jgi:hypothetical protein